MSKTFEDILEQVQFLNKAEQLALISSIAEMLSEDEIDQIPKAIIEKNRQRLAAYDAGKTTALPYQDAMRVLRKRINKRT